MTGSRAPKPRRRRTATESLLSIALGLEAALVFFVTMTVFGLGLLPPALALGGGAALFVIFLVTIRLLRYDFGVWLGWVLQAVVIASGEIIALLYLIGAGFVAVWIYCYVTGRRLDRRAATNTAEEPK